jgi:uncharacterized protein (TIGR00266 family)
MDILLEHAPAYTQATVRLKPGESIRAESGAMVAMSPELRMETSSKTQKGGLLKGLARKMLTGESFFLNTFRAEQVPGEVRLAQANVGDMALHGLAGELMIQSSCFVACHPDIEIQTKVGGFKSWFGGKGFFMMKAVGTGPLLLGAFGAVAVLDLTEPFIVDTGHIVAFEPTLDFKIRRAGGWFSTIFSGEGFVCEFNGRGKLWIQSRNASEFGSTVGRKLPPRG